MKPLITGICGFVGSSLAQALLESRTGISIYGIDNLIRPGSELNRARLRQWTVALVHGDLRMASEFESLPAVDWVIDAAAVLALEYGVAFDFPVWINRCGVLAGTDQFGTPDQGVFSYWTNAHAHRRPLRYIGFDGTGKQPRDAFHPRDLAVLANAQMNCQRSNGQRIYSAGGRHLNLILLAQLTAWCDRRFGEYAPAADTRPRPYDLSWVVVDSSDAQRDFRWRIQFLIADILEEIAQHREKNPNWLEISRVQ